MIKNKKIAFDIDGVLADWLDAWMKRFNIETIPSTYYFDNKIPQKFKYLKDNNEINDFFLNLKPLINSDELIIEPSCYITSRPIDSDVTKKWLNIYNFPDKPVFTVDYGKSKLEILKKEKIDILIDDFYENFIEANNNGILCYLVTQKHNIKYNIPDNLRINHINEIVQKINFT